MGAGTWFLSGSMVMMLFNFFYISYYPATSNVMVLGALTGLIVESFVIGTIAGIQFMGTGLNSASIKIIFGVSTLLNALFQIQVSNVPVGVGLANNVLDAFVVTDYLGFGWFIASSLALITLLSGIVVLVGSSN